MFETQALNKFAKKDDIDKYLDKYTSVRIVFISGEEMRLSRADAISKKKQIMRGVKRHIISDVYKEFGNGKEIKVKM